MATVTPGVRSRAPPRPCFASTLLPETCAERIARGGTLSQNGYGDSWSALAGAAKAVLCFQIAARNPEETVRCARSGHEHRLGLPAHEPASTSPRDAATNDNKNSNPTRNKQNPEHTHENPEHKTDRRTEKSLFPNHRRGKSNMEKRGRDFVKRND